MTETDKKARMIQLRTNIDILKRAMEADTVAEFDGGVIVENCDLERNLAQCQGEYDQLHAELTNKALPL